MARPVREHAGLLRPFGIEALGRDLRPVLLKTGVLARLELAAPRAAVADAHHRRQGGLVGMMQLLAPEWAPGRIRVVGIAPGLAPKPMIHKHVQGLSDERRCQIEARHPLGVSAPRDVAAAVALIASGEAQWVSGITMPLGWTNAVPPPVRGFVDNGTSTEQPALHSGERHVAFWSSS